jgi:hypothetical protein
MNTNSQQPVNEWNQPVHSLHPEVRQSRPAGGMLSPRNARMAAASLAERDRQREIEFQASVDIIESDSVNV